MIGDCFVASLLAMTVVLIAAMPRREYSGGSAVFQFRESDFGLLHLGKKLSDNGK
jgi:hypothetical protein